MDGHVRSLATVVGVSVTAAGERQVLGVNVGPSEDRASWTAFLRGLVKPGVRLVISDAHEGLKQAIATVVTGATWQRCRVHFMRNLLATAAHCAGFPRGAALLEEAAEDVLADRLFPSEHQRQLHSTA